VKSLQTREKYRQKTGGIYVVVDVVERILLFGVFVFVSSLVVILLLFQMFCKLICINYNKLERFVASGGKLCI
jgi:hypothetical protein